MYISREIKNGNPVINMYKPVLYKEMKYYIHLVTLATIHTKKCGSEGYVHINTEMSDFL